MRCLTAWGQWAVELPQYTASLPGRSGQCNSCNALPHCLGAVDSATPAMHCLTAWGQWAVPLLQSTAALPGGSGQCSSCNALPHCLGAVGSATPAMHCLTALGQQAVQLLQCTASLPGGSGQCNSCNALPHRLGAVGSATPAMRCLTAWGQWAVELLQCSAPPPGGSGQRNSCNALPHCLGGVGSATPAMHCLTAWGQWAVERPQYTAPPWGAIFFREPGAPARGGRGVLPRGCSESPARPVGGHLLQRTGRTGPGGTGSPAQGVFGASCQGQWGAIFFREPGAPAWGGRGVLPRGCSESPARPMGGHLLQRTGRTGPGGTGSPAQGVFGVSCKASGGPSSSENRAHRPGGDGESCPGGVRSLLPGPMGGHLLQRTGRTGLGGTGSPAQGVFGVSCQANGGPSSSENRVHRPGGDGEPSPGGVRSLRQDPWVLPPTS